MPSISFCASVSDTSLSKPELQSSGSCPVRPALVKSMRSTSDRPFRSARSPTSQGRFPVVASWEISLYQHMSESATLCCRLQQLLGRAGCTSICKSKLAPVSACRQLLADGMCKQGEVTSVLSKFKCMQELQAELKCWAKRVMLHGTVSVLSGL